MSSDMERQVVPLSQFEKCICSGPIAIPLYEIGKRTTFSIQTAITFLHHKIIQPSNMKPKIEISWFAGKFSGKTFHDTFRRIAWASVLLCSARK